MAIRARDIRQNCTGKVDPAVLHALEALAEEQHRTSKLMAECISTIQMMEHMIENFNRIGSAMKDKIDQLERANTDPAPDLGDVTK